MALVPLDIPPGFHGNGTDLEESNKWIDGSLVRWLDGSLRPIGGWRQRVDSVTSSTVRGMHSWQANDNTAWMACGSYRELKAVNGGGTVYDITPDDLVEGREDGVVGTGYGAGRYGRGLFGVPIQPETNSIPFPATTWDLQNFGEILIACSVDDGVIWEWDLTVTPGSELVTNGDFAADSDWTKGAGWAITGGVAEYTGATSTALEQTVSGLENASNSQDTHDITITLVDPDDDADPATTPDAQVQVIGTTTTTVLVDEQLSVGVNRIRFGTDDSSVQVKIIANTGNTVNFNIDDVSLRWYPVAEPVDNAPTDNLGVHVTEERFIFALGSGGNPRKVAWCDFEDRDTWTPSTTNQAGSQTLQTSGQIMCAVQGRGNSLIITDTDAHSATYVGPPYIYQFNRVGTHCGAVSRKSAVSTDKGVFWYGQENFFYYDGNTVSVLPCDVHDLVFGDFNTSQQSKVWGMVNGAHQEVWWFYPSGNSTECDKYVAFDLMERHWLVGDLARTSGVSRGVFIYPIMAQRLTDSADLMDHEVGHNYDGSTVYAETGPMSMGVGDQIAKVSNVIPDEKTQGDVQMTFKTRFYPNGTESSHGPFDPTNPTSVRFSGRQVRMRVEQDQAVDWRVGIMRLNTVPGGTR